MRKIRGRETVEGEGDLNKTPLLPHSTLMDTEAMQQLNHITWLFQKMLCG